VEEGSSSLGLGAERSGVRRQRLFQIRRRVGRAGRGNRGEATARSHSGGGLANKGGRRCAGDRRGAGGRGVSEVVWQWRADRRARPAQCRAARIEYNSNSNEFKLLQNFPNLDQYKTTFPSPKFLR
jgi:hypothetical protein